MGLTAKLKDKRWLKWVGYSLFFQLSFLVFLHVTFPGEVLRDRLESEATRALGKDVTIGAVKLAGLSGVTMTGVRVQLAEATPSAEVDVEGAPAPAPAPPPAVALDAVTAKAELLPLLRGRTAIGFDVDAFGGSLSGRFERGEDLAFEAKLKDVVLQKSPMRALVGLDLEGTLSSVSVELRAPGNDFAKAEGSIAIHGEGLVLNGGEVQQFELPKIVLGALEGKIDVKEGKASIEQLEMKGDDLEARLTDGSIRLAGRILASSITGKLKLKPADPWWKRNEMLKSAADLGLPAGSDGFRTLALSGQLQRPRIVPQR